MRKPSKGRRICFICAIRYKCGENNSCMVPNSFWNFIPGGKQQKGDYHESFNGKNYYNWFQSQLLRNLVQPSVIIMDNAAIHKCLP